MIRGVLFDMDGVLLDTERAAREIVVESARSLGYPYTREIFQSVQGRNKQVTNEIYRRLFGDGFPSAALNEQVVARLAAQAEAGAIPYKKGFEACMDGLRARKIKIALATSTDREQVDVYRRIYPAFRNAFDVMACGMEVPKSKPEPDIYLLAAQKLGLSPTECLGVEDSYPGLASLRAAGTISVMIPDLLPYKDEIAPNVDYLLDDLTCLCPLIDRLNGVSKGLV